MVLSVYAGLKELEQGNTIDKSENERPYIYTLPLASPYCICI